MRCPRLASAVASVLLAGCQADRPAVAASPPATELPAAVSRSQKPDGEARPGVQRTVFESAAEPFQEVPDGRLAVQIRAQVNGVAILDDEVRQLVFPMLLQTAGLPEPERSRRQAEIFRQGLQQLIDREVALQDAFTRLAKQGQVIEKLKQAAGREFDKQLPLLKKRAGVKTDDELKDYMRAHGLSLEGMRRQAERDFMYREYVRNRVFPAVERGASREAIRAYYDEHKAEFQVADSVKWQDVFIDAGKYATRAEARAFAEQLAARARSGEDFANLAKYDNGDSIYRNGEGYGSRRGEIKPVEAEAVLFGLHDGEVAPVVEVTNGFHVIRLVKRQVAGQVPLDEKAQAEIRRKLQMQIFEQEAKRFIAELKTHATIEVAP